jgi:site-specific recombinase XerD
MNKSQKPLKDHISDFLDWLEIEKGLSSKTQENYSRFLKKFIDWLKENNLDTIKPHDLSSEHVWDYRAYLARKCVSNNKNLKKSTQNYYLIALRSLLGFFTERDIVSLPADKIKLARDKNERVVKFLSLEQLESLFGIPDTSTIQGLRDRSILEVFFSTGMRISELVSLDKEQIKIKQDIKDLEIVVTGKGGKTRTVYVSERAVNWLKKYLERRNDTYKPLFINLRSQSGASKRLTPRSIEKMVKKCAMLAGLPNNITPHALRHSFATDLLSQGVDLRSVQEFLGHSSITATQIYTHVTNKRLRDIHKKFHGGQDLDK